MNAMSRCTVLPSSRRTGWSFLNRSPLLCNSDLRATSGFVSKRRLERILILAGAYATYSKWINIEIELAEMDFSYSKPIIAIAPWGSERISEPVREAADRIVRWNTESIVKAVRDLAR